MHEHLEKFKTLFEGNELGYGTFVPSGKKGLKEKVEGYFDFVRGTPSMEDWQGHLGGRKGLRIVPINSKSKVRWGAIDVDDYAPNVAKMIAQLNEFRVPVVPCYSKSGGLHLYLFVNEWVAATMMRRKLFDIASLLGVGDSEIFPSQSEFLVERDDNGKPLNLPYFDEEHTSQFALSSEGRKLSLGEFVRLCAERQLAPSHLEALSFEGVEELTEGPPCLQHLIRVGIPAGHRNDGLYNLAVYAKKAHPDSWEDWLHDANVKYIKPPVEAEEVRRVISSVGKKDYKYKCRELPIRPFCNRALCRTKKFGVGGLAGMPVAGTLTKIDTTPAYWILDIEGGRRVEFTTKELQQPYLFQLRCMEVLGVVPPLVKKAEWDKVLRELFAEMVVVGVAEEMTPKGQFADLVEEYCLHLVPADTLEEISRGRVWTSENGVRECAEKRHYFTFKGLMDFLDRKKFRALRQNQIVAFLRSMGYQKHKSDFEKQSLRFMSLPYLGGKRKPFKIQEPENVTEFVDDGYSETPPEELPMGPYFG